MTHLTRKTAVRIVALGAAAVALAACGGSDSGTMASSDARTVNIAMKDNLFTPSLVTVANGETVRFVFRNTGQVTHDAFLGDAKAQEDKEMEMRSASSTTMGNMDKTNMDNMSSAMGNAGITVAPGKTGELTHTFQAGEKLLIGCHEKGHYAGGMKITIVVS